MKIILIISGTSTLSVHSTLGQGIHASQYDFGHLVDFTSDQFTCGGDRRYYPQLDLPPESHQNIPNPDFEDGFDQAGIYSSAPQPGNDSTTLQQDSPNLLAASKTISQASSSGSNPRKSKSPDLGGATQSLKTAVSGIRWPSPESSDQSQIRDPDEKHRRRGRRNGSLPPTKRTKVSETRRIGACMFCALAKVEVLYFSY